MFLLRPMHDVIVPRSSSGFQVVGFFAVLRDVETFDLIRFAHADASNHIRYFQQDNGSYQGEAPREEYAYKLITKLAPVAVQSSNGLARAENRVDHLLRKDPGQERADRAACAVNAEGIEGIVIAEDRFYFRDHPVAD